MLVIVVIMTNTATTFSVGATVAKNRFVIVFKLLQSVKSHPLTQNNGGSDEIE